MRITPILMLVALLFLHGILPAGCIGRGPPGGDRDEHGCLTGAGYAWCGTSGTCMRKWEETCPGESEIDTFEECAAAGYPVMESYPRQCRVPGGPTFTDEIAGQMTEALCRAARGHWNECSSRCRLDNAGRPGVICPALCEALCECGGIAGFGCPDGFTCRLPPGTADAFGYCVPGSGAVGQLTSGQAMALAEQGICATEGSLTGTPLYNEITRTWWIDLTPSEPKTGCNPACIVDEATGTSDVNWRCTGFLSRLEIVAAANLPPCCVRMGHR